MKGTPYELMATDNSKETKTKRNYKKGSTDKWGTEKNYQKRGTDKWGTEEKYKKGGTDCYRDISFESLQL